MALILAFLLLSPIIIPVSAEFDVKSCRAALSEINKKHISLIGECTKQLDFKTGREKAQKSTCVWKCVLTNIGLLTDAGSLDQTQYNIYLLDQWPAQLIDRVNVTFQPCLQIPGPALNTNDEFCKEYEPLTKCLNRNYSNLCKRQ